MNNIRKTELHIRFIGNLASEIISTEQTADVFGVTSRGVFVKFINNKMIFLSFEDYRGPLTVNLSGDTQPLINLSTGETVAISQEGFSFPDSDISITKLNAKVWKPPKPKEPLLTSTDRINLIHNLALAVYQHKKAEGLFEMLPVLARISPEYVNGANQFKGISAKIDKIRIQFAQRDLLALSQTMQSFLGLGSGLTPSGDDFIIGLLLSLNRWEGILQPGNNLSILNSQMVEAAYSSTTTLSANLIECTTLGLADERLIQVVDFLAVAKYNQDEVLTGLLNWGNSSGADALVGMITAFLPLHQSQIND